MYYYRLVDGNESGKVLGRFCAFYSLSWRGIVPAFEVEGMASLPRLVRRLVAAWETAVGLAPGEWRLVSPWESGGCCDTFFG